MHKTGRMFLQTSYTTQRHGKSGFILIVVEFKLRALPNASMKRWKTCIIERDNLSRVLGS